MNDEDMQPLTTAGINLPDARVRTFLIADLRGFTRFTQEHGDEAGAQVAARFAGMAREAAEAHGGRVTELRGDEALAVFDSPRGALRAAIALRDLCRQAREADPPFPLSLGIGLDSGEAMPVEEGYRGGALNLAARLCGLSRSEEIFASEGVIHLARKVDGLAYADRGRVKVQGIDDAVRVYQIDRQGELPARLPQLEKSDNASLSQGALITGMTGVGFGILGVIAAVTFGTVSRGSLLSIVFAFFSCLLAFFGSGAARSRADRAVFLLLLGSAGLAFTTSWWSSAAVILWLISAGLAYFSGQASGVG